MGQATSIPPKRDPIHVVNSSLGSAKFPSIIEVQSGGIHIFVHQDYEELLKYSTDQYRMNHFFQEQHPTYCMRTIFWPFIEYVKFYGEDGTLNLQGYQQVKVIFAKVEDSADFMAKLGGMKNLTIQADQANKIFVLLKKPVPFYFVNSNFLDLN